MVQTCNYIDSDMKTKVNNVVLYSEYLVTALIN